MTATERVVPGLVSVIVPAVRNDTYAHQAVTSLLADGYPTLEIVVIWDGPASLYEPAWEDEPSIRQIVNGAQLGIAESLNRGIASSHGEFVARLDADDISYPGRLGTQVDFLRAHASLNVVATAARIIGASGELLGDYPPVGADVRRELLRRNPLVHSSLVMRRAALDEVGGYDPRLWRMEDYALLLRLACHSQIGVIERPYVGYRLHPNQTDARAKRFWGCMQMIAADRRQLRRCLGGSVTWQRVLDAQWVAAQWARYHKLRSPRVVTAVASPAQAPARDG